MWTPVLTVVQHGSRQENEALLSASSRPDMDLAFAAMGAAFRGSFKTTPGGRLYSWEPGSGHGSAMPFCSRAILKAPLSPWVKRRTLRLRACRSCIPCNDLVYPLFFQEPKLLDHRVLLFRRRLQPLRGHTFMVDYAKTQMVFLFEKPVCSPRSTASPGDRSSHPAAALRLLGRKKTIVIMTQLLFALSSSGLYFQDILGNALFPGRTLCVFYGPPSHLRRLRRRLLSQSVMGTVIGAWTLSTGLALLCPLGHRHAEDSTGFTASVLDQRRDGPCRLVLILFIPKRPS